MQNTVTDRFGPGITSFVGAAILAIVTIPFLFLSTGTSYRLLRVIVVVRGLGLGLSILPMMTAALPRRPASTMAADIRGPFRGGRRPATSRLIVRHRTGRPAWTMATSSSGSRS